MTKHIQSMNQLAAYLHGSTNTEVMQNVTAMKIKKTIGGCQHLSGF